jgi:hypothetical protein
MAPTIHILAIKRLESQEHEGIFSLTTSRQQEDSKKCYMN